jgi:hypothetical protein
VRGAGAAGTCPRISLLAGYRRPPLKFLVALSTRRRFSHALTARLLKANNFSLYVRLRTDGDPKNRNNHVLSMRRSSKCCGGSILVWSKND